MLKNALASEVRLFDTFFCLEKSEIEQIIRVGGECKTVLSAFFIQILTLTIYHWIWM